MEKIINQSHSKENYLYAVSKLLERMAYYGLRSLIVLYMIDGVLKLESSDAISIYGWITMSLLFSQILGAILGDLVLGNKKAILLGAILQALGAFTFCIPSMVGLYSGIFLVVLGGGFYTPNTIAQFGKQYLQKTKLLDAGFTMFFFAINLGAFLGSLTIAYLGEVHGYSIGFVLGGFIMILSIIPILLSKENEIIVEEKNQRKTSLNQRIGIVMFAFVLIGVFWAIYEMSNIRMSDLQLKLSEASLLGYNLPHSIWSSLSSIITFPLWVIAVILWTKFYSSHFFKLMVGFVFAALSFGLLLFIPEYPQEQHAILYLLSMMLLAISEIYIGPIIYSTLTRYSNPKYLAIIISLAFIPAKLFILLTGVFNEQLSDKPTLSVLIGFLVLSAFSVGLIVFNLRKNKGKMEVE